MLYSDYLYSSPERNRPDHLEESPKYIKYLLNRHNLKHLYYGDSPSHFLNLQKLKKSHLTQLQTIFENNHNCLIDFKYFGYAFLIERSMIEKIPLLEKYYRGCGVMDPNYYIYNNQNKEKSIGYITSFYKLDSQKIKGLAMIKRKYLDKENSFFSDNFGQISIDKSVGSTFL